MDDDKPAGKGAARHFTYRIPIRMTPDERRMIGKSAQAQNRSVSRYLVELATRGPSFRSEEKSRLSLLHAMFREANKELKALLNMPQFAKAIEGKGEVDAKIKEVARLLAILTKLLERRLNE